MDSSNRLSSLSIVPSIPRQTPRREFGDELAHALGQGAQFGAGVVNAVVPAPPVVSAAVSAISRMVAPAGLTTSAPGAVTGLGSGGIQRPVEPSSGGTASDTLAKQAELNRESQAFTAMYLQLQSEMQAESRQYNAVSNVIKVRHESARAAINNIR
ncbi:MAG: hypothetical protein RL653_1596 [Pseudomonadota bacterium]|jgi:hypothetical protein